MSLVSRHSRAAALVSLLFVTALGASALAPSVLSPAAPARGEQAQIAGPADLLCPGQGDPFLRTELFFGSSKPDGSMVTEAQFRRFLDEEITPRFPDGLTLLTGLGQFRGSSGTIVRERSMVLILLYPKDTARASSQKIEQIRAAYKTMFQQESVLRADDRLPQCVFF
jgi:hypothetical protein